MGGAPRTGVIREAALSRGILCAKKKRYNDAPANFERALANGAYPGDSPPRRALQSNPGYKEARMPLE
jgi:hypothetical protein